jgi:hypothetical protein
MNTHLESMTNSSVPANAADIEFLNGAIELSNAEVKVYNDAASLTLLSPPVLAAAKGFMADHEAHPAALTAEVKAATGTPSTAPAKLAYRQLRSEADILTLAKTVEPGAATAYLSEIGRLSNPQLAKLLSSRLGVETTRVSTWLRC